MFNGKSFNEKFLLTRKYYDFTCAINCTCKLACVPACARAVACMSGDSMKLMQKIYLSVSGEQASKHLASSLPLSDFYILSGLLSYFSGIPCAFHFGQIFNGFLKSTFDFY